MVLRRGRRPVTVALIGPDGVGKTTVGRLVAERSPVPTTYVYMGVNREASTHMLPTTRLAHRLKRGAPDTGPPPPVGEVQHGSRGVKAAVRLVNQLVEEWYLQLVVWSERRAGKAVLFDRHFFADFHAYDIAAPASLRQRVHGAVLARLYPRPDVVVYLDAPAEVVFARKREGSVEAVARRQRDYLALAPLVPRFVRVDATQPVDRVVDDVVRVITTLEPAQAEEGARWLASS